MISFKKVSYSSLVVFSTFTSFPALAGQAEGKFFEKVGAVAANVGTLGAVNINAHGVQGPFNGFLGSGPNNGGGGGMEHRTDPQTGRPQGCTDVAHPEMPSFFQPRSSSQPSQASQAEEMRRQKEEAEARDKKADQESDKAALDTQTKLNQFEQGEKANKEASAKVAQEKLLNNYISLFREEQDLELKEKLAISILMLDPAHDEATEFLFDRQYTQETIEKILKKSPFYPHE